MQNYFCTHCKRIWTLPANFTDDMNKAVEGRSALGLDGFIKTMRPYTGMGLIELKYLFHHVSEYGNCIACQTSLPSNGAAVKICDECGAMNLDPYSA